MTMDLIGPGGQRQFNLASWGLLLDLATRHGWQPAGALEPEGGEKQDDEEEPGEPPTTDLDASDYEVPRESPLAQAVASLLPPADDPVRCSYYSNSGFRVTPEDARSLADALERALADVPDHDALGHKTFLHPALPGVRLVAAGTPVNPYEWFGGKKDLLRDFIAFCRQGGFELW
jgi:hypothetical protein